MNPSVVRTSPAPQSVPCPSRNHSPAQPNETPGRDVLVRQFEDTGRILGKGGTGTVVEVKEPASGRLFAKKTITVPPPKLPTNCQREKAILECQEAQASPFVLHAAYVGNVEGSPETGYALEVVTDLCRMSLYDFMCGPLELDVIRYLAAELVCGLQDLHNASIIHRDLKPENLLLSKDGHVVIADFGLSRFLEGGRAYTVLGTHHYLAPELIDVLDGTKRSYGKEADLWSLGVLLYVMRFGVLPFYAEDLDTVLDKIEKGKWSVPRSLEENEKPFKDLLDHLLTLDPAERWTIDDIQACAFFKDVKWPEVRAHKSAVPQAIEDAFAHSGRPR